MTSERQKRSRRWPVGDGPCSHPGCFGHITHPCEGCGRIGGPRRMTIYTLGYSGWKVEDMEKELDRLGGLLVDVRFVPRARWTPQWNSAALGTRLKDRYIYLRPFGNKNYKGTIEQTEIVNYEEGRDRLVEVAAGRPVVLLCGCRDVNNCHRKILADLLAADWGQDVMHLNRPPKDKLSGNLFKKE